MKLSPPITILVLLAAGLAGVVWLAPPQRAPAQVAVHISATTYDKLAVWGKAHPDPAGQPLTVAQAIGVLAEQPDRE